MQLLNLSDFLCGDPASSLLSQGYLPHTPPPRVCALLWQFREAALELDRALLALLRERQGGRHCDPWPVPASLEDGASRVGFLFT